MNELRELIEILERAEGRLKRQALENDRRGRASTARRLIHEAAGVRLAKSYAEEILRERGE